MTPQGDPQVPNHLRLVSWAELHSISSFSTKTFEKIPDPDPNLPNYSLTRSAELELSALKNYTFRFDLSITIFLP